LNTRAKKRNIVRRSLLSLAAAALIGIAVALLLYDSSATGAVLATQKSASLQTPTTVDSRALASWRRWWQAECCLRAPEAVRHFLFVG
jgi:hypothetical protein